jgi:hypothetical protein
MDDGMEPSALRIWKWGLVVLLLLAATFHE